MPRYFFHVKRSQVTVLDQEGIELANPVQAEEEALRRATVFGGCRLERNACQPWNDYRR